MPNLPHPIPPPPEFSKDYDKYKDYWADYWYDCLSTGCPSIVVPGGIVKNRTKDTYLDGHSNLTLIIGLVIALCVGLFLGKVF